MKMNKAVFLDRDGIINIDTHYLHKIEDFKWTDGIFELLKKFQDENYFLIVITNQAGIARGYFTEKDFHILNDWMIEKFADEGINIKKVFYCPFHPDGTIEEYKKESFDRKPNPGMILKATEEFDIDLSKSILIGDKESDIEAGIKAGIGENILIESEYLKEETKADLKFCSIKYFLTKFYDFIQ
jgi:D-glycero-D-manno-heptose 1,7-bisphosphate phosphatase